MDPNETLTRIRDLQETILAVTDGEVDATPEEFKAMAIDLAKLILILDEWLKRGGSFPRDWKPF